MSKVIDDVRQKIKNGQDLFRRSTIEKMLAEYDRLLMRNVALEKRAVEQSVHPTNEADEQIEEDLHNDNDRIGDGISRFIRG